MKKFKRATFSLDEETIDLLEIICKLMWIKKSQMIRRLIKNESKKLIEYENGN